MSVFIKKIDGHKAGTAETADYEFVIDSVSDLADLPANAEPGSIAYGATIPAHMLTPSGEWVKVDWSADSEEEEEEEEEEGEGE